MKPLFSINSKVGAEATRTYDSYRNQYHTPIKPFDTTEFINHTVLTYYPNLPLFFQRILRWQTYSKIFLKPFVGICW